MPQKTLISNFNAVESNNALTFDKKTIAKMFKDFFSNLAESLLIKLPSITSEEEVFKTIKNINILKVLASTTFLENF